MFLAQSVSPDNATFAGDIDLLLEKKTPACMSMDDLPAHTRAAAESQKIFGLAGAACLDLEPAYGITGIYRFTPAELQTTLQPVHMML